ATASEDRLTFAALRVISRHRRAALIKYPKLPWARLFPFAALLVFAAVTFAWCGFFGLAYLACDLGTEWRTWKRPGTTTASELGADAKGKRESLICPPLRQGSGRVLTSLTGIAGRRAQVHQ